jgi:Mor family transcriptional regulator
MVINSDESDIVKDILARVQEFVGPLFFTHQDIQALELEIKNDWGGESVNISNGRSLRLEIRDKKLLQRWDSGVCTRVLCKEFNLDKRTVYRILEKYRRK